MSWGCQSNHTKKPYQRLNPYDIMKNITPQNYNIPQNKKPFQTKDG